MKANDLREMQRDLETGRHVDPDKVRRAVEFAADVAELAECREWDTDNRIRCALAGREVFDLSLSLHKEVP